MKIDLKFINKINIFLMLSMIVPYIFVFFLILMDLLKRNRIFYYFFYKSIPFILLFIPLLIIAILNNNESFMIYHHARDYVVFFVISIYLTTLCQTTKKGAQLVYYSIKNVFVILAIIKIFILFYVNFLGANMVEVLDFLTKKVGIPMMQSTSQSDFIFRLQFPTEAVLPFLIYFVIKEIDEKFTWITFSQLLLLLISLLLTLSRAFWAVGIFYIVLGIFLETQKTTKMKISIVSFILLPIFLWLTNFHLILLDIVQTRFGNKANDLNYYSDLERNLQNKELWIGFFQEPVFGKGLGYYIPYLIRDQNDKYMYESQVLSYLMDFGIILFSLFILITLYFSVSNNYRNSKSLFLSLSFFFFWIILSSYNPLLLGISGAILIFFAFNANKFSEIKFKH
ncbi:O-antigen ligase family protein [Acinetobacter ursingii]|uniref:O-antigen ligase family protein n=1 Tax=Acinetobacter ursingii TaxID=108980 RepID=UPI00300BEE1F